MWRSALLFMFPLAVCAGTYRIVDGDTVHIYEPITLPDYSLRLANVNAAETNPAQARLVCNRAGRGEDCVACELKAGIRAKQWAKAWAEGKTCTASVTELGFQGRFGGDVYCNGESMIAAGIAAGHLKPSKDKRGPWCD